jgi:chemotaxis protein methyltransferase CheR
MFIEIALNDIHPLLNQIEEQFHFDLREYSTATLRRRIHRILLLFHLRNLDEFSDLLKNDPSIFPMLLNELTVNTTEMFRDVDCWKSISKELIPKFPKNQAFKVWHNGCSSGEEVYSFLILAMEAGLDDQLELIGTDVNTSCLEVARSGIYEMKFMDKYNQQYIASGGKKSLFDYGETLGDHYFQFHQSVRDKVTFSYLDIIQDGGVPECDMIFSRNVLIYFMMPLQERIFSKIYSCLKKDAYFCLGKNENLAWTIDFKNMKESFENKYIFQKSSL